MRLETFDLGLSEYQKAWDLQKQIFSCLKNGALNKALILCQHQPVITLGRNADRKNILVTEEELKSRGIQIFEIERGGDVTYHGPGQLTIYPLFNLEYFKKDIHLYLRNLEGIVIDLLSDFGIKAQRKPDFTGVWVEEGKKIASIGIAIRNWITFHGLSINIKENDLQNFRLIRPCGMDIEMTSRETVLGRPVDIDEIKKSLVARFRETMPSSLLGIPVY
jgi:lipoate-protein ligase B